MVHGLERPQHVECKLRAATAAWSSYFQVLRSFQSMHPSHSSGNYHICSKWEINVFYVSQYLSTIVLQVNQKSDGDDDDEGNCYILANYL